MLLSAGQARAQLDNRAFMSEEPGIRRGILFLENPLHEYKFRVLQDRRDSLGQVLLSLNAFTFFKDNEYFNKIIEGYTLFGTQLNPQLAYYPIKGLRLEAGVFLWKDFGNPQLQLVRPTYRATWTKGPNQFILGNIRPHLNHQYIEPLFNFERVMLNPLEEGLQYRLQTSKLWLDVWVDWQRQQYRYSNYQEQLAGGLSSRFSLTRPENAIQVVLPFQFTATHSGGQIDTLDKPLQTLFNEAIGLEARMMLGYRLRAFRLNAYALGFQDRSFTQVFPFKRGAGLYLNGTLETKHVHTMLSYWQGRRFIAPLGGDLYQGVSRTVNNPAYREANRHLLLLRLLRDFRISDAAALTVRVEPVYDLNARLLDFSFGIYLNFRQEWLLGNVRQRVRVGQ
ncbi:hypothetical protein [uncultured Hymenobacter sp.]|uniref:hypothetical protein n=1 Tax=uncultured Hymenobacter sp. TaxID=170016 RepID=UPI0035CA34D2